MALPGAEELSPQDAVDNQDQEDTNEEAPYVYRSLGNRHTERNAKGCCDTRDVLLGSELRDVFLEIGEYASYYIPTCHRSRDNFSIFKCVHNSVGPTVPPLISVRLALDFISIAPWPREHPNDAVGCLLS